jgi:hypothetical protein
MPLVHAVRQVSIVVGLVLPMLGYLGCAARSAGVAASDCQAVEGSLLPAGTSTASLAGSYDLLVVARTGPQGGQSTRGTLQLVTADDGVWGHAQIPLREVGGEPYGDIASEDPQAPGVRALPEEGMIFLRFGSEANRRDRQAIEGPYMVLHVRLLRDGGLYGTWASGAERTNAEGHFCAFPHTGG